MPRRKIVILNITPETHVRTTQGDIILFRIKEQELRPQGLRRLHRIQKYNRYKTALRYEAQSKRFEMPEYGAHITFYIPVPQSWRPNKKKIHHLQPHQQKPDNDNLVKAFKDSVLKEDKAIWDYRITKRWINSNEGYIEIELKR